MRDITHFYKKLEMIDAEIKRISSVTVPPSLANPVLEKYGSSSW